MKRRTKKASLNMSISTIVVLILAMTLLGFGLMFIRGIFSKAGNQFEQVSGDVEKTLKERLTETNERVVMMQEDFEGKKGTTLKTYFALRNDLKGETLFYINNGNCGSSNNDKYCINETGVRRSGTNGLDTSAEGIIECYTNDGEGNSFHTNNATCNNACAYKDIQFKTIKQILLKEGEVKIFPLTIKIKSSAVSGTTYYCKIIVGCNDNSCTSQSYYEKNFNIKIK